MSFLRPKTADPLAGVVQGALPDQTADDRLAPDSTPAPTNILQTASPDHPRRSIISTIGQLADVFAKVGGAPEQYQPNIDANLARVNAADDRTRQVDLEKLKLATAQGDLGDANRGRTALVARAYAALKKANPNADLSGALQFIAQQNGIDPQHAEALRQTFEQQPGTAEALASFLDKTDGGAKYGGNIIYATGPDGKLKAFQAGLGEEGARSALPDGYTPVDPLKFVDAGDRQVGVGTRTGQEGPTIVKGARPDTVLTTKTQRDIAKDNNTTKITIAGMPARGKGGASDKPGADASGVLTLLDNIQNGFRDLHGLKALPGDNSGAVGNVLSAIGRTGVGQAIGEQAGTPSAQKRLEIAKNVSALQQAMLKSLPASATRTKFEQEMLARGLPDPSKMSYGTAQTVISQLRSSYLRALQESQGTAKPTRTLPPKLTVTPPAGGKNRGPSVSNW